jgi:hypothetical protein
MTNFQRDLPNARSLVQSNAECNACGCDSGGQRHLRGGSCKNITQIAPPAARFRTRRCGK